MKIQNILLSTLALSAASSFAADYVGHIAGGNFWWNEASSWTVDGEVSTIVPGRDLVNPDNVTLYVEGVNAALLFGGSGVNLGDGNSGYRVNNLNMEFTTGAHMIAMQQYYNKFELQVMNDLSVTSSVVGNRQEMVSLWTRGGTGDTKNTLSIVGDLNLSSASTQNAVTNGLNANSFLVGINGTGNNKVLNASNFFKQVRIGGDINLTNKTVGFATENGENVDIAGRVNFNDAKSFLFGNIGSATDAETLAVQKINVGGLNSAVAGAGVIRNAVNNAASAVITIQALDKEAVGGTFTDFNVTALKFGGDFSGTIQDNISVVMNYAGQTQKLSGTNLYTGTTTIKAGKLLMSNISSQSAVYLQGGQFGAVGSEKLSVSTLEWTAGGFAFDFSTSNFTIEIGTLTGTFLESMLADFDFINATSGSFDLLSITNATDESFVSAFDGKTIIKDGFEYLFDATQNKLSVSVTQVPEASTYAMIFGALALAFVAYRKRK